MKTKNRVFLTLTVAICCFASLNSFAQKAFSAEEQSSQLSVGFASEIEETDSIYTEPDVYPEIIGGMQALIDNIVYPQTAKDANKQGMVFIETVVSKTGSVQSAKVKKGTDPELDKAALEAVKKLTFKPGSHKGKTVPVSLVIPIRFALDPQSVKDNLQQSPSASEKKETTKYVAPEGDILTEADVMPEPIGGIMSIFKDLVYPEEAVTKKIEGKVLVSFVVDEQGNVVNPIVLRGIGYGCDESAVKAVSSAKFTPGKHKGKTVKVKLVLPVMFKLN